MELGAPQAVATPAEAAMRELILAIESYRAESAAALQLTVSDSQAVSHLIARGPLGQTELAHALSLTSGSVTPLVDRLERAGIAERIPHATDRRRSTVQLTRAGLDRVAPSQDRLRAALGSIDPVDLDRLTPLLLHLAERLRPS